MALDIVALGTVPAGEAPAAASEIDYVGRAFWQCRRCIDLVRHTLGGEPEGAKLRVRRTGPDFDPYLEVVVEFDEANPAARAYANRCDREAPTRWDQTAETASRLPVIARKTGRPMKLLLIRHAAAMPRGTPGAPDDERPLTLAGTAKFRLAARWLARVP